MKAVVLVENLQKRLSLVNHAISSRNQLPILSYILLEAKGEGLSFSATDLEIGIETSSSALVSSEGSVVVPAKLFLELVNTLSQEKVTLELLGNSLEVTTSRTKSLLQTLPADEFPRLYEDKGTELFSFEAVEFQKVFSSVVFAASAESTKPALAGVLIVEKEEEMHAVTTDGFRLSFSKIPAKKGNEGNRRIIVPAKVIREALQMKGSGNIGMFVAHESNQVIFSQGETNIVGRVIEGEFPNYEKVLPLEATTVVEFDRESLLKAVRTSAIFAREAANIIKLSFLKRKIIITARTPSLGENTVEVEAKLSGEENEIAFNARYVLEALGNIDVEDVTFEMTGPLSPGVFKRKGDDSFLHVIMPIRTTT